MQVICQSTVFFTLIGILSCLPIKFVADPAHFALPSFIFYECLGKAGEGVQGGS